VPHSESEGTLHLTRAIPVPESVSSEAQALMTLGCATVAERLATPEVFPALDDRDGWKARIAAMDRQILMSVGPQADAIDAAVEKSVIEGIDVFLVTPVGADTDDDAPVLYQIHGGGLTAGGGEVCRAMAITHAAQARLRTWAVDYRMPPDYPYPTPLEDCLSVYRALLKVKPPEKIVVGGGSAGGNLAAALMLKARAEDLPMPACLLLRSPEVDLTESGDSFETNKGVDYVLVDRLSDQIALYANGQDLTDPFLSPLFGDVSGFPPTFLHAGTRDLFLSNTVRLHRKLCAANIDAVLHIGEAMPHGGFFGFGPEEEEFDNEIRKFVENRLGNR
jgi:monoterpene epsilon-lactone hydrolase